jgi:hypothetical protein
VSPRGVVRVLAGGRVAIGAGLVAAPRLASGLWIGRDAASPAVAPLGRALGVREIVLGAMALHTLDRPAVARRWLRALALCDAVDLAANVAARRALPAPGVALIAALAGVSGGGLLWAARALEPAEDQAWPERS